MSVKPTLFSMVSGPPVWNMNMFGSGTLTNPFLPAVGLYGIYNSSPPAPVNGQPYSLQFDATGNFLSRINNSATSQVPTNVTEFEISSEITRAANTTAYSNGQIINGNGASTLPTLDFSGLTGSVSRKILINTCTLLSSNGTASPTLSGCAVHLFNVNNPQTVTDATAYNPTYAILKSNRVTSFESLSTLISQAASSSNAYVIGQNDVTRVATTDSSGHLYPAIVAGGSYTPANGETITLTVKGYLLN